MSRDDPFEEIERLFDQMSRQFEGFDPAAEFGGGVAVDLADTGEAFEATADLPGFGTDDIDVTLPNATTLRIEANRETERETEAEGDEEGDRYIRRERRSRSVSRTLSLPERVDESGTSASYDNGVLTVTLPKRSESGGTDIPVS